MANEFDPYYTWLGIAPEEQPPNHYRLLGLAPFEANPEVISNAADQRMTFLRTFQTGKQSAHCQRLLNEVAAARVCLLGEQTRGEYDRQMRESLAQPTAPTLPTPVEATPIAPLSPSAAPEVPAFQIQVVSTKAASRRRSPSILAIGAGAAAAIVLLSLAAWAVLARKAPEDDVAVKPPQTSPRLVEKEAEKNVEKNSDDEPSRPAKPADDPSMNEPVANDPSSPPEQPIKSVGKRPKKKSAEVVTPAPVEPTPPESNPSPSPADATPPVGPAPAPATPEPPAPEPPAPEPPAPEPAPAVASPAPPEKIEPPDDEYRTTARKQVRELFKKEWLAAKQPVEKQALASRLADTALDTRDDPRMRYVLLEESLALSAEAGDQAGAFSTIDRLDQDFAVDLWKMKLAAFLKIGEAARMANDRKRHVDGLLGFSEEAQSSGRFDVAAESVQAASVALSRFADVELRKRLAQRKKEVDELKKLADLAELARKRLETEPDNPKANLALGRFQAFVRGEWDAGLALLAKGDDAKLQEAATKDIARPTGAAELEALANLWSGVAPQLAAIERPSVLGRAHELYTEAARDLTSLAKLRVEKRIEELDKQLKASPGPSLPRVARATAPPVVAKAAAPRSAPRSRSFSIQSMAPLLSDKPDDPEAISALRRRSVSCNKHEDRVYSVQFNSTSAARREPLLPLIEQLKGLPNLVEVGIFNTTLTEGALKAIGAAVPNLRRLRLLSVGMPDSEIREFASFKNLEQLNLFANGPFASPCRHLASLANLHTLELGGGFVLNDDDFQAIGRIRSLTSLSLGSTNYSGDGFKHLATMTQLEILTTHRNVPPAALKHLQSLVNLSTLTIPIGMRDADMTYLKRMANLSSLDLTGTMVTDAGLAQIKGHTNLTTLRLPRATTDNGMRYLEPLVNLQSLQLQDTKVTERGLRSVRALANLRRLQLPETIANLQDLSSARELNELAVSTSAVAAGGLSSLSGLPLLHTLRIFGSRPCGDGLKHVKEIQALQTLYFEQAAITDESLKHLGAATNLRTIQVMNGGQLTDAGLAHLTSCINLRYVAFFQMPLTSAGVAKFKEALPACQVSH